MIEQLLRAPIVAMDAFGDLPGEQCFPGEEDLIAGAVTVRRREFITARRCAHKALTRLGYPPSPIKSGPHREPLWPDGVVGSITHCPGYRAAAVAARPSCGGLGIDAEPHESLPEPVRHVVATPTERLMLDDLARSYSWVHWDRLLFSAKESIYKACFPQNGRWLGFDDAELVFHPGDATFSARITRHDAEDIFGSPPHELTGGYLIADGLIVTAVRLPATRLRPPEASLPAPSGKFTVVPGSRTESLLSGRARVIMNVFLL